MHKISLSHAIETSSVYPFPASWQTLALTSMRQHLWTERFAPIDGMLKADTQKITPFQSVLLKIDPEKLFSLIKCEIDLLINNNDILSFHKGEMYGLAKQQCSLYVFISYIYNCLFSFGFTFNNSKYI